MLQTIALLFAVANTIAIPPMPSAYVTDNAGALSSGSQSRINAELASYYKATGNRIFVWIGQTTGNVPLEDWTIRAAEKWRPGTKQKDNGAILFLFMKDRKIRIEVGYGLEPSLTDAQSSRIIRETIRPKMRAGDVDGAVGDGVDRMLLTITPSFKDKIGHAVPAAATGANDTANGFAALVIALVFFGIFGLFIASLFAGRRGRHGAWYWGAGGPFVGWSSGGGSSGGGGGFSGGFGGGFGGGGATGGW